MQKAQHVRLGDWKLAGVGPANKSVLMSLELILGLANLGQTDRLLSVGENEKISVGEIIERFQLSDFLG